MPQGKRRFYIQDRSNPARLWGKGDHWTKQKRDMMLFGSREETDFYIRAHLSGNPDSCNAISRGPIFV